MYPLSQPGRTCGFSLCGFLAMWSRLTVTDVTGVMGVANVVVTLKCESAATYFSLDSLPSVLALSSFFSIQRLLSRILLFYYTLSASTHNSLSKSRTSFRSTLLKESLSSSHHRLPVKSRTGFPSALYRGPPAQLVPLGFLSVHRPIYPCDRR